MLREKRKFATYAFFRFYYKMTPRHLHGVFCDTCFQADGSQYIEGKPIGWKKVVGHDETSDVADESISRIPENIAYTE